MPMSEDLGTVEHRSFDMVNFRLQSGTTMTRVRIANETYGWLAADGKNAVLITHGCSITDHAAGRNPANANLPG
jgi:homoserine acetyltransferase